MVDNTFASPYLQTPLALGADVVLHSTTKYLGGHSDVVGGALVTSDDELAERLRVHPERHRARCPARSTRGSRCAGSRRSPCAWSATATTPSASPSCWPATRPSRQVLYPGLPEHPGHEVAAKQMRRFGGMVSFPAAGGREAALRVCAATELFTLAESLGGVESLIEHPAAMTHASVAGSALEVPDDLVRLSVGIEDVEDLVEDLRAALDAA